MRFKVSDLIGTSLGGSTYIAAKVAEKAVSNARAKKGKGPAKPIVSTAIGLALGGGIYGGVRLIERAAEKKKS